MPVLSDNSARHKDVPLNEAPFPYSSDLGYYDTLISAASESQRQWFWATFAVVSGCMFIFASLVFASIVVSPKARKNSFNLFLLYLTAPDMFYSGACAVTCFVNLASHHYASPALCKFQSFYLQSSVTANSWVNGAIGLELYGMLRDSHIRKRYFPPSNKVVSLRCVGIFLYSIALALVVSLNFKNVPIKPSLMMGETACLSSPYGTTSILVFFFVFFPLTIGIPSAIVGYVVGAVVWRGYLPPAGKKRMLALFFFRLVLVFALFWVPAAILYMVFGGFFHPAVQFAGGILAHFQVGASALLILKKDDIYACFMEFICCGRGRNADHGDEQYLEYSSTFATMFSSLARRSSSILTKKSIQRLRSDDLLDEAEESDDRIYFEEQARDIPDEKSGPFDIECLPTTESLAAEETQEEHEQDLDLSPTTVHQQRGGPDVQQLLQDDEECQQSPAVDKPTLQGKLVPTTTDESLNAEFSDHGEERGYHQDDVEVNLERRETSLDESLQDENIEIEIIFESESVSTPQEQGVNVEIQDEPPSSSSIPVDPDPLWAAASKNGTDASLFVQSFE